MFKNITNEVLSWLFNYFHDKQEYHGVDLPLSLSEFYSINEAITINAENNSICINCNNCSYFLDYVNLEHFPKKVYDYLVEKKCIEGVKMSFKDAPIGSRFRYPNHDTVWVKINSYPKSRFETGNGLIAKWEGNKQYHQQFCSFTDDESGITFDTEIELI